MIIHVAPLFYGITGYSLNDYLSCSLIFALVTEDCVTWLNTLVSLCS